MLLARHIKWLDLTIFYSQDRELDDLDMGMRCDATYDLSELELHQASYRGDLEGVKRLTGEKHLNPLQTDEYGRTALHYAAGGGHIGVLKYFSEERGYNPTTPDDDGATPLHNAAAYNHLELVQYLVAKQLSLIHI